MARPHRIALGICLLAFLLRLGAFFAFDRIHHPDIWEAETIAVNLLEGRGFVFSFLGTVYRSYEEPLYPALCALVYLVTGHSFLALGVVQAVLGSVLVWLVFVCGRAASTDRPALWAAFLAAVHPGLIVYATKFSPFVLDSILLLLVLTACLLLSTRRPWWSAVSVGTAVGLCALTRATILGCLPIIGWWVWNRSPGLTRTRIARLVVLVASAALVLGPWVLRNYEIHHRFLLTRSGSPHAFWLGNNPHVFTGSAATPSGTPLVQSLPASDRQRLSQVDEMGQQDFFGAEARRYVSQHPLGFVKRWATKFWYFWWQSPQAGRLYPTVWFRVYQGYYLGILALSVAGAAANRRRRETMLIVGFCLSIAAVQSVFFIEGRHRLGHRADAVAAGGPGDRIALAVSAGPVAPREVRLGPGRFALVKMSKMPVADAYASVSAVTVTGSIVRVSYEEYLAREKKSETKHEYVNGEIYSMAGGTPEHGRLAIAVGRILGNALAGRPCAVFSSDVRVRIEATGRSTYPDLSVVCGRLERAADDADAITNPVAIVEILSESTEASDRGDKFAHYRQLASLREYVLVSQSTRRIEVFRRNESGDWVLSEAGPGQFARLESIDVSLPVDDVYHDPLRVGA